MGEYCNKDINSSVGGLVWVRRRNGSWWPGRILEPAELPESCLPTPRSGTPVKLLGREDASVDWYNLEKSKRVKAFRCGEYNECIEKAKATSNSSRKAVKYARREDAILHALELESAHLEKDQPDFSSETDVQDSEHHEVDEQPNLPNPSEESKDDSSSSEDDLGSAPEGVKRMRGLDDLGIGAMSSLKRKRSPVANVHEFLKRKHRRRTLTKVLENTPMVSVPIVCDQLAISSDSKVSELESDQWKNYNLTGITNNAEDEPPYMVGSTENDPSDRLFEVPLTDDSHNAGLKIDKGTSMWQIKGKRNSRVRKVDLDHEPDLRSGQDVDCGSADGSISGSHTCPENELSLPGRQKLLPYRRSRFTVNPKYDSPDFSYKKHHNAGGSGLYEVTVEVRTGSQPQQIPYVSLMSKLNGQPIVGHLLAVEVIDDGFCDQRQGLLSKSRRNGLLSKKTRKISSLTGLERQTERERLVVEKDKGNAIACVPLKVVFSRINAALHM